SVLHHPLDRHRTGSADLGADRARGRRRDHGQEPSRRGRGVPRLLSGPGRAARPARGIAVRITVQVVDDELLIRKSLGKVLRAKGYAVELASNGAEGLEKASEARPHVMILD